MLKKAIKIVVAVVILLVVFDFVLSMFAIKSTPRSHYVRMNFHQLSIAIAIYHIDGSGIPSDIEQLYEVAITEEYMPLDDFDKLTFKDGKIYDIYGSEIVYSYDEETRTCSFKSFGLNKVDDNGEKDDIVYEDVIGGT